MRYFARHAQLPDGPAENVLIDEAGGVFTAVVPGADAPPDATRLDGVVLPGFANCHSHAFHRGLRGRTHDRGGTFWTWREDMYRLAARLHPDSYLALARATYAEMALSGITAVGEFHYLHHAPGGARYDDPNVMAEALRAAAADAGIRLTLLDTCYLAGGLTADGHLPLDDVQRRFGDGDVDRWAARVADLAESPGMRVGSAAHSVRAVPRDALRVVDLTPGPTHVHVSEQPAENDACRAFYGMTPVDLLAREGFLGPDNTFVHATHLDADDLDIIGGGVTVCMCPTTERDLADGIGPAREVLAKGDTALSLGTDQNAVIDMFEEARGLELDDRLASLERGRFSQRELLTAMTNHASIGWDDAGRIEVGRRADLVAVRLDTTRTAGADPAQVVMAALAPDVHTVVVDGRVVVADGEHRLGNVGRLLRAAIDRLWEDA